MSDGGAVMPRAEGDDSDAFATSLGRRLIGLLRTLRGPLSIFADAVGVSAFVVWAYQLLDGPGVQVVTATFVCVTAAGLVVLALRLQYLLYTANLESARARRLARAQPAMAQAQEHLTRAAAFAGSGSGEQVRREGDLALTRIAEVFTAITGAGCRATVKQVHAPEASEALAVQDLFRSHPNAHRRDPAHIDWVRDNSDFEDLLADGRSYWLSKDILKEFASGYKNSHISREQIQRKELPYRSVLVVRIAGPGGGAPIALEGFLCIDSESPGIFRRDFDVSAAQTLSHALYSLLIWFRTRDESPQEASN